MTENTLTIEWSDSDRLTSQVNNHIKKSRGKTFDYNINNLIDNRFLILNRTKGGMSDIYFCFDLDLQDLCTRVLKTLTGLEFMDSNREIIERETKIWIGLGLHPNIVKCDMILPIQGKPFILLEWIASQKGRPLELSNWLYSANHSLETIINIAYGIAKGMAHANQMSPGIVHQDLKPGNILIDYELTPKITDFGISNILNSQGDKKANTLNGITARINNQTNIIIGSPLYMSPEQWKGESLDQRTDIYGFGCVLYEMLSRRLLYTGLSDSLREKHIKGDIPNLSNSLPDLIKKITYKCLNKNPNLRFQTFLEVKEALSNLISSSSASKEQDEYNAFYYGNQALAYINLGEYEKAEMFFEKTFALDPHLTRAYNNRGIMYWKMEKIDSAIADFSKAIDLDQKFAEAYANRGALHLENNNLDQGLLDLNHAVLLDANIHGAWSNRAQLHLIQEEFTKGLWDIEKALELTKGHDLELFLIKAELLFGLSKYQESLELLNWLEDKTSDSHFIFKIYLKKIKPLSKIDVDQAINLGKEIVAAINEVFQVSNATIKVGKLFLEVECYQGALPFFAVAMKEGIEEGEELAKFCITKIVKNSTKNDNG